MRTRRPHPKPVPRSAFSGFRFPPDVIVLAVAEPVTRRLAVAFDELALAI